MKYSEIVEKTKKKYKFIFKYIIPTSRYKTSRYKTIEITCNSYH